MRSMTPLFTVTALVALAVIASGCGGGGDGGTNPPPDPTAAELTAAGWTAFEAADLSGAATQFDAAVAADANFAAGHLGRGWTRLGLATTASAMQTAASSFTTALGLGASVAETRAGRAAAYLGAGGAALSQAIADAQAARSASSQFVFSHRTSFNVTDLRLIEAFAQAAQGDFAAALAVADGVTSSGINAGNPASWVVQGVTYGSFTDAVMAFLQHLSTTYAG